MADHADYADNEDNAVNGTSGAGRAARNSASRRRTPVSSAEPDSATLDAQPTETTLDLFGEGPAAEFVGTTQTMSAKVSRAMASPAARRAARQKAAALTPEALDEPVEPAEPAFHADPAPEDALVPQPSEAAAAPASAENAQAEPGAAKPYKEKLDAAAPSISGFSYAPTSASGSPAHLTSVVHATDFEAAVHGPVNERTADVSPVDLAAALAVQARRTKWMLTVSVAALAVTAVLAIAETAMLANFSADSQAQQQRIELLMQNQQAALDKLAARLDTPPVATVAPMAIAPAATSAAPAAARAQSASAPSRHAARAARKAAEKAAAEKAAAEKSAEKAGSHASARTRSQQGTRPTQTAKN
jgi:hypothetical protein